MFLISHWTMADELHDILLDLKKKNFDSLNAGSEKLQLEHPEDLVMSVYQWLDPEEKSLLLFAFCPAKTSPGSF